MKDVSIVAAVVAEMPQAAGATTTGVSLLLVLFLLLLEVVQLKG